MGNGLVYRTTDPAKIAEQLEEKVRADLGSATHVPFEVHDLREQASGGYLRDLGRLIVGTGLQSIATVVFTLPWHRPAKLAISARRIGLAAYCNSEAFEIGLVRDVEVPVTFAKKRFWSAAQPDAPVVVRLNGNGELVKALDRLLVDNALLGSVITEQKAQFSVEPDEAGTRILGLTLAHPPGMFKGISTFASEMLAVARMIERSI